VDFTELGEYLKPPIGCYSQGMMLRLAFGIGTAIQPEIILVDEIIGGGDQAFAEKARQRLKGLIEGASLARSRTAHRQFGCPVAV
jgi:ABC-type polysaccharide/polyol phosphate transport system ATPase subunit